MTSIPKPITVSYLLLHLRLHLQSDKSVSAAKCSHDQKVSEQQKQPRLLQLHLLLYDSHKGSMYMTHARIGEKA